MSLFRLRASVPKSGTYPCIKNEAWRRAVRPVKAEECRGRRVQLDWTIPEMAIAADSAAERRSSYGEKRTGSRHPSIIPQA